MGPLDHPEEIHIEFTLPSAVGVNIFLFEKKSVEL